MTPLPRLHGQQEYLDEPRHDAALLEHSLDHVAAVNRWLGGRRALLRTLEPLLRDGLHVLDVGTGSADLPRTLVDRARQRGLRIQVTATDVHPQMREFAAARCAAYPEIRVEDADALALPYHDDAFDVTLFSMVLHHLDDAAAVQALTEAARVSTTIVVNELHRTHLNYAGARLLSSTIWSNNRLTRHDGPLSVLRAYVPDELHALARAAGLEVVDVRRRWFQRVVMVARRRRLNG